MSYNNINTELVKGVRRSFGGCRSATIEFIIISDREMSFMLYSKVVSIQDKLKYIILLIKEQPVNNKALYLKTTDMAQNISVSKSFLEKNMNGIFQEGKHFYKSVEARLLRWDVIAIHQWMKGESQDESDKKLLSELLD